MSASQVQSNYDRREEIFQLLSMSENEVIEKAGEHLEVMESCGAIHDRLANDMADFIERQNEKNEKSRFILPVGPVRQYPILKKLIHQRKISLKNTYLFFMDDYADDFGHVLAPEHPCSFEGQMRRMWIDCIDESLKVPESQIFFPSEKNVWQLDAKIREAGGIDICFGGVGFHGHIAFNEPERGVRNSDPRLIYLNEYSIALNAIRAKVGGNLAAYPRKAFTLGMKQIMAARKLRLVSRNGISLDWANTSLRVALFGEHGDDYPCSYINEHDDYLIYTDPETVKCPEFILR